VADSSGNIPMNGDSKQNNSIVLIGLDNDDSATFGMFIDSSKITNIRAMADLRALNLADISIVVSAVWASDSHVLEVSDIINQVAVPPSLIVVTSSLDEDMITQLDRSTSAFILQRPLRKMEVASTLRLAGELFSFRAELHSSRSAEEQLKFHSDQASRLKSEFLSLISHELRTPLTEVVGYAELLKDGSVGELGERNDEFVDSILRSSNKLGTLIDDLMTLSKAEAKTLEMKTTTFTPKQLLDGKVTAVLEDARSEGYQVEIRVDETVGLLKGDRAKLTKVLLSLLSNAIKFTPSGGRVGVEITNAGSAILFKVYDSGRGISQDKIRDLFHAFRQEDSSDQRQYGGLGIGLSLVKHFVELHGGNVRVTSRPNQGTVFSFVIPRRHMAATARQNQPTRRKS